MKNIVNNTGGYHDSLQYIRLNQMISETFIFITYSLFSLAAIQNVLRERIYVDCSFWFPMVTSRLSPEGLTCRPSFRNALAKARKKKEFTIC